MTSETHSNSQSIIDALGDYANLTGVDLSKNPFAEALQQCNTPDVILQLLQEREKAFKEYRDGDRRLIKSISPGVRVIHALSNFLGEAISLVSCIFTSPVALEFPCQCFDIIPLGPLSTSKGCFCRHRCSPSCTSLQHHRISSDTSSFQAASGVSSSYGALLELFECLGGFLKRLEIYTSIPPSQIMTDIIVKILLELLSVLALATKQIKQGRFSEPVTVYKLPFLTAF